MGSLAQKTIRTTAAAALVLASAGYGVAYAWQTALPHGLPLACIAVLMAAGLELAKPSALEGAFAAFSRLSLARGFALALVGVSAVAYSLTAELTFQAMMRGDMAAERAAAAQSVADAREERDRLLAERAGLPAFAPTEPEAVKQAQDAVAAFASSRADECRNGRGPRCRKAEEAEAAARASLAAVSRDAGLTERAAVIEKRLGELAKEGASGARVGASDPGASALVALAAQFGLTLDPAVLAQLLPLIGVVALEAGAAFAALIANGLPSPAPGPMPNQSVAGTNAASVQGLPTSNPPANPASNPASNHAKTRSRKGGKSPAVAWVSARVVKRRGAVLTAADALAECRVWCAAQGLPVPTAAALGRALAKAGARVRQSGGMAYRGLALAPAPAQPAQGPAKPLPATVNGNAVCTTTAGRA